MDLSFASDSLDEAEFDRRRRIGRQSGNPAWLWPEVSGADWAHAMAAIAGAISSILAGDRTDLMGGNVRATSVACYTAGVGPLLGWWAEQRMLVTDAETGALLALHLDHAGARARRVAKRSRDIVAALADADIPVIVLKGGATAYSYFPVSEVRPSSDLDLLVPGRRMSESQAALESAGLSIVSRAARDSSWKRAGERRIPGSLWLVHADDPWSVDLHSSLDSLASAGARVVRLDFADPFDSDEAWPLDPRARVLPQPLLLLHLAVHASAGLHNLTLLRLVELILVIRKDAANGRLSWGEFQSIAARTHGLGASYPALRMCEVLAPGTIPEAILNAAASAAPARVHAVIRKFDPATSHRVDRASVSEHFMWVTGVGGWLRQLRSDIAPDTASLRNKWSIWEARAYRLLRGRISR